jgi:hypothetical protein
VFINLGTLNGFTVAISTVVAFLEMFLFRDRN